jgi:hypothetical protein
MNRITQSRAFPEMTGAVAGRFEDIYTFSLRTTSDFSMFVYEFSGREPWTQDKAYYHTASILSADLERKSASGYFEEVSPTDGRGSALTFSALAAGDYRLTFNGVSGTRALPYPVLGTEVPRYEAHFNVAPIAEPVPEASDFAMTVLGLAAVAGWRRWRVRSTDIRA